MGLRAERRWGRPPTLDQWQEPTLRRRMPTLLNWYDLLLLFGLGVLLPFLPGLPVQPGVIVVLRVIVGVPALLVAPGFALVAALFPGRGDLDGQSRAALSFGLSIAAIAVLAAALGLGPWGIRPLPIALALSLWIAVFGGVAIVRRRLALSRRLLRPSPGVRIRFGVLLLALALIAGGIFGTLLWQDRLREEVTRWWPAILLVAAALWMLIALVRRQVTSFLGGAALAGVGLSALLDAQDIATLRETLLGLVLVTVGLGIVVRGFLLRGRTAR